ncbi:unnamed protein product [Protopolystoma xenopodis]|uniref:Translation elongation factor EFG/EF2 domain-containing protein n=1 Tax=Protopolystoma xenopodis TaxID=117903 RepID=A0A3S5CQS2_9PLAT|nr:unnamed protein product [Protopolystoma xenopodis]
MHKKQSGGAGQFGRVIGVLEPLTGEQNTQLFFKDETSGTRLPKNYVPSIRTGFELACASGGYLIGQPVVGVRFRLQDGDHHAVDSSDWSFQLATMGAMRDGTQTFIDTIALIIFQVFHRNSSIMLVLIL